jgi:hypothetical protein
MESNIKSLYCNFQTDSLSLKINKFYFVISLSLYILVILSLQIWHNILLNILLRFYEIVYITQTFHSIFFRFTWLTKIKDIFGPEYKFPDDCMTDSVSLTDILSHRTGLISADLLLQAGVPASVRQYFFSYSWKVIWRWRYFSLF